MIDKNENLSKRIAKAKGAEVEADDGNKAKAYSIGWRIASEMIAGLLVGFIIGYYLDNYFETSPLFLLIFIFLGCGAGILGVYKLAVKESGEDS